MEEIATPQHDKKASLVFVDTCVVQYSNDSNKSKAESVIKCLASSGEQIGSLTISEITVYEYLHGLFGSKRKKALAVLSTYEKKIVSARVLLFASILGGLYHDEKIDGIEMGDKLIAATAITENGYILTANHKDYPHPFFVTEESFALPYQVGHYKKTLDIVLYKPNLALLVRRLEEKSNENANKK
ncbi:MAG: PIN domain-containing protein [Patescibacteria group bacterium]